MILLRENPLLGKFEGMDPENLDLFWAQMALALLFANITSHAIQQVH
jgi:hypothetical protein